MEWTHAYGSFGRHTYAEAKHGKHDIELGVYRMDDEHNRMYPNNATGWKYRWHMDTTESFYCDDSGTVLADGYTMTLEEGIKAAEKAFENIEKYRRMWKNRE